MSLPIGPDTIFIRKGGVLANRPGHYIIRMGSILAGYTRGIYPILILNAPKWRCSAGNGNGNATFSSTEAPLN